MLIPVEDLYPNTPKVTPKTDGEVIVKNLLNELKKKPWFERLYQDVVVNQRTTYTIKCKYPIDTTTVPTLYEGYQLKYTWDGKCTKNQDIYSATEKFRQLYGRKEWFYDVQVSKSETTLEVTLKNWLNIDNQLDYFEDFPVRYGLLPKPEEEDSKNFIP